MTWNRLQDIVPDEQKLFEGTALPSWGWRLVRFWKDFAIQLDRNGYEIDTELPKLRVGTTALRPTAPMLRTGEAYFDTDLGIPIWFDGTNWVDATGSTV